MDKKISSVSEGIQFQANLVINASISDVWQLLTTTEGLAKWFPELKGDQIIPQRKLIFEADGFKEEMDVLDYVEMKTLKIMWDSGQVTFELAEAFEDQTALYFKEILPLTFPNLYQDLAGWDYELQKLKAAGEGTSFTKNPEEIQAQGEAFKRMIQEKQ